MVFCHQCREVLPSDARYCTRCGVPQWEPYDNNIVLEAQMQRAARIAQIQTAQFQTQQHQFIQQPQFMAPMTMAAQQSIPNRFSEQVSAYQQNLSAQGSNIRQLSTYNGQQHGSRGRYGIQPERPPHLCNRERGVQQRPSPIDHGGIQPETESPSYDRRHVGYRRQEQNEEESAPAISEAPTRPRGQEGYRRKEPDVQGGPPGTSECTSRPRHEGGYRRRRRGGRGDRSAVQQPLPVAHSREVPVLSIRRLQNTGQEENPESTTRLHGNTGSPMEQLGVEEPLSPAEEHIINDDSQADQPECYTEYVRDYGKLGEIRKKTFPGLGIICSRCSGDHPHFTCNIMHEIFSWFVGPELMDKGKWCQICTRKDRDDMAKYHLTHQHRLGMWYDHPEGDAAFLEQFDRWRRKFPSHVIRWKPPPVRQMYKAMSRDGKAG